MVALPTVSLLSVRACAAGAVVLSSLLTAVSCEKDDWSPPGRLSMLPPQPSIEQITRPPELDDCEALNSVLFADHGWFRAKFNGVWYTGTAILEASRDDSSRYTLFYAAWDYEECWTPMSGAINDLSPDPNDPFASLPWVAHFYGCDKGSPPSPTRVPYVREQRTQTFGVAYTDHEYRRRYMPDTTEGLRLQIVIDDFNSSEGFAQGRFAAHYIAGSTCPDLYYVDPEFYIEDGYFEVPVWH